MSQLEKAIAAGHLILDRIADPALRDAAHAFYAPTAPKSPTKPDHRRGLARFLEDAGLPPDQLRLMFETSPQAIRILTCAINVAHRAVGARTLSIFRTQQAIGELTQDIRQVRRREDLSGPQGD